MFLKVLAFDDVLLRPLYSEVISRSDIDLSLDIKTGMSMRMPVFAAPMDTIMNSKMATVMWQSGGRGVMHRYCSIEEQADHIKNAQPAEVFAAVGITGDYLDRAFALVDGLPCTVLHLM